MTLQELRKRIHVDVLERAKTEEFMFLVPPFNDSGKVYFHMKSGFLATINNYNVIIDVDGGSYCSCSDYLTRKRACKHIAKLVLLIENDVV